MITNNSVQVVIKNGFETLEIVLVASAELAHEKACSLSMVHTGCRVVMQNATTGMAFGFYKNGDLR